MSNFHTDLKVGQQGEDVLAQWLVRRGYRILSFNDDSRHDIFALYENQIHTFEAKFDQYPRTGNMVIEVFCLRRMQPTGLAASKSDFFAYIYSHDRSMFLIRTDALKEILRQRVGRGWVTNGGDNNQAVMVKLPIVEYADRFQQFNIDE